MNKTIEMLVAEAHELGLVEMGPDIPTDQQRYWVSNTKLEEFVLFVQKQTRLLRFIPESK